MVDLLGHPMRARLRDIPFVALLVLTAAGSLRATEIWSDEEAGRSADLDVVGKWTSLASRSPDHPLLFPERSTLTNLARLRLNLNVTWNEWARSDLAYEQRARWVSTNKSTMLVGGQFLPSTNTVPWRIEPLDWEITEHKERLTYRHEIDRALTALQPEWGQVLIGRQAIGLGRGVVFGAVDLFAPF